jgi:hypothetical protein
MSALESNKGQRIPSAVGDGAALDGKRGAAA